MKLSLSIVLVQIVLSIVYHGIQGKSTHQKLSAEQNLEIEKQLNSLNKPPILSFKKNGDVIDCVDIYKQPAFDHPLLKNHNLQMRPSSLPKGLRWTSRKHSTPLTSRNKSELEGCPHGSVPFRRIQKADLLRAQSDLHFKRPISQNSTSSSFLQDVHYAAITTPRDSSRKFYGAKVSISVYNLTDRMNPKEVSEALLWLGTAVDGPYNSIEYGWTAHEQLYGDSQPRIYSMWTADGLEKTGCYNANCPGYVQVSRKRFMGEIHSPASIFGEVDHAMEFTLFKDPKTSNWWILENLGNNENEAVGYWPKELFPNIRESAAVIQTGGKVYSPSSIQRSPPMGSGDFVPDDFTRTCYASNIEFVDSSNKYYVPKNVPIQVLQDVPDLYKANYLGDVSQEHPKRGYTLLFGGPVLK